MKFFLLALLTLATVGCASHENREPSSERNDDSRRINNYPFGHR